MNSEIIFMTILAIVFTILAVYVLHRSGKILSNAGRNAWDVLYLNSVLAILALFFIGLIAKDLEVWKFVVGALGVVAAGEKLSSVLRPRESNNQGEVNLDGISSFLKKIEEIRIHYLLLSFGFLLVALSIVLDRYFVPSFFLFVYAIGVTYIQLARKQDAIDAFSEKSRRCFYVFLFLLFIFWSLFWLWAFWRIFKPFSASIL